MTMVMMMLMMMMVMIMVMMMVMMRVVMMLLIRSMRVLDNINALFSQGYIYRQSTTNKYF